MAGRVKGIQFFLIALLVIVGLRALDYQIIHPDQIIIQAHKRFDHAIELSPHRGTIYDKSGQPLAISLAVKSIAANPRIIDRPSYAASKLSKVLGLDRRSLEKRLRDKHYFVWIKRHTTPDEVEAVKALNIKGIGFYDEAKRFYPESESLANLIGFVGVDGQGLEGLELLYDPVLKGKERKISVHKDGMGRIIYARGLPPDEAKDGYTLWLTIDRRIQYIAFTELKKAVMNNKAQSGFAIITNPWHLKRQDPVRFDDAVDDSRCLELRMFVNYFFNGFKHFPHGLQVFCFAGVLFFQIIHYSLKIHMVEI